jgi:2,3-bisphosphoglycerate-independent phosphoglycerate mutase
MKEAGLKISHLSSRFFLRNHATNNLRNIFMKPVILIICDGLGHNEAIEHNAVAQAMTPNLDEYWKTRPRALLEASGESIGLPEGQMGTSEANHLVIGSGRIVYQNLVKINRAMRSGEIGQNEAVKSAFDHVNAHSSTLHLLGMMSPGGVHSHTDHLKSLVHAAKEAGVKHVSLHVFTDGRDVAPKSALEYLDDLEAFLESEGIGRIVSIGGRYWGMDRDNNADRIEKHFNTMCGLGDKASCARDVIVKAYEKEVTDEFIEPASIEVEDPEVAYITPNDAVIATNFRADRARQMSKHIVEAKLENLHHVAMTKYDDDLDVRVAFEPEEMTNTLSEVVSRAGVKQLRVTETEKFTHLTFFFNAQKYEADPGEDRVMIDSDKSVKTYDEKPEMRATEIADEVIKGMESGEYGLIITNLVNCDMVGHTGNLEAIKLGVQAVDTALGRICEAAKRVGADVLITADHGNAEQVFDTTTNQALTSHTLNPVPFILVSNQSIGFNRTEGFLSDIAPTILMMMHLDIPSEMTGKSFISGL